MILKLTFVFPIEFLNLFGRVLLFADEKRLNNKIKILKDFFCANILGMKILMAIASCKNYCNFSNCHLIIQKKYRFLPMGLKNGKNLNTLCFVSHPNLVNFIIFLLKEDEAGKI